MTSLQSEDECQSNDPNNLLSIAVESSRFPLDSSIRIVFTGYYNGFSVEVRSADEMALLYHMGCFGKGTASRSKPKTTQNGYSTSIMRKRQFLKRNYWFKKFANPQERHVADSFISDIDELTAKIIHYGQKQSNRDVIDLVSSDEHDSANSDNENNMDCTLLDSISPQDKQDLVVIVPDSDSEEGNYFENLKPKCCINKIKIPEKLMLTLQEAFFLAYALGCLQVIGSHDMPLTIEQCWKSFVKTDKKFVQKYVVYHYFRSKGYIVKSGIKFGGDYVLYKESPSTMHADYIVVIKCPQDKFDWISVLGHMRMATTTVKEILIAEVDERSEHPPDMPEGLQFYSVREILLTRNIPVVINEDID